MPFFLDSFFDWWRVFNLIVGLLCVVWSIGGFIKQQDSWNLKTLNMWYSRLMFAIADIVVCLEGIHNNKGWSWTLGIITIAGMSSFVALCIRGEWGYVPPSDQDPIVKE